MLTQVIRESHRISSTNILEGVIPVDNSSEMAFERCARCGNAVESQSSPYCATCQEELIRENTVPSSLLHVILGLVFGLLAAVAVAFGWSAVVIGTEREFFYLTFLMGFAVTLAIVFGAKRRPGVVLTAAGVILSQMAFLLANYLIIRSFTADMFAAEGIKLPYIPPVDILVRFTKIAIEEDPTTIISMVLVAVGAIYVPFGINKATKGFFLTIQERYGKPL